MKKELSDMTLEELWELFPIILKEHNEAYKDWYTEEKDSLIKCLGEKIKRINHIGSTSVPDLIAKPTVDILLEIDENYNSLALINTLKKSGWIFMADNETPKEFVFNKGYTPNGFAEKVYHLHVRALGDWDELYFPDYLKNHRDVALKYGKLKLDLIKKYEHNRDGYTEAKTSFVKKYTKLAREEYENRYSINKVASIVYREIKLTEMSFQLFCHFNRYQEVKRCWRMENEKWVLKDSPFVEKWGDKEYEFLIKCLQNTIKTGGSVFGAFENNNLVGFASLENQFFGSDLDYLQLSSIHVTYEKRGAGIGKELFHLICEKAKEKRAKKLYISSHSCEETQAFYKNMGCIEAIEKNPKLVADEPFDCQLEYNL